ncbi:MAG: Plug domain-containing protein, partial [Planctomycetota bacterium]
MVAPTSCIPYSNLGFFLFLFLLLSCSLWAENNQKSPLPQKEEEKILIQASPISGGDKGDSSTFATSLNLESSFSQTTSLSEILWGQEGVFIRRLGEPAGFSTISIRGFSSQQVKVLLDGFPLNTAQNGSVDFSNLPLVGFSKVEILRGGDGSRYGSGSIGGVLYLHTKKGSLQSKHGLSMSYGSYNTAEVQLFSQGSGWKDWKY